MFHYIITEKNIFWGTALISVLKSFLGNVERNHISHHDIPVEVVVHRGLHLELLQSHGTVREVEVHEEVLEGCDVVRLTHTEPVLRGHAHRLHHPRGYRVWQCEVNRRRTFWSVWYRFH